MQKNTPIVFLHAAAASKPVFLYDATVVTDRCGSCALASSVASSLKAFASPTKLIAIHFAPAARTRTKMADEVATTRPDYLKQVAFKRPSSLALTFPDRTFSLAIERLEMSLNEFRWETAKAGPSGNAMMVKAKSGEVIPIDASILRYLVDAKYAAKVSAELAHLRFSRQELEELSRNSKRPSWF